MIDALYEIEENGRRATVAIHPEGWGELSELPGVQVHGASTDQILDRVRRMLACWDGLFEIP